ncbi:MAG: ABC transporter permease [Chloroflexi bacterium]|nr:ABC transporter permease [Chloroflexota bacterium]
MPKAPAPPSGPTLAASGYELPATAAPMVHKGRPWAGRLVTFALPALGVCLAAFVWEIWVRAAAVPVYLLPAPSQIALRLAQHWPSLAVDGGVTLTEALLGFALSSAVSITTAAVMTHFPATERTLMPLAILLKVTPMVAVAPLLIIWLGFGIGPKAVVAALITFYPMLINALTGFRSVAPEAADLLASLAASRWETFWLLRWPSALPYLFAGARVAVPLSLVGAVVGEWAGAERGLGRLVLLTYANLDLPGLFAAVIVLALLGVTLTAALNLLERRALHWMQGRQ